MRDDEDAQLYHQKQMLTDHNRMAAYHAAIVGNADIFKDKVVMDVGTGSGILAGEPPESKIGRPFSLSWTGSSGFRAGFDCPASNVCSILRILIHFVLPPFCLLFYRLLPSSSCLVVRPSVCLRPVWAAQAGAKRVYAIEYTDMANHARRVVKANGVEHIVTVIQGAVEDVTLPQEDWDGIGGGAGGGIDGGLGLGGLTLEEGDVEVHDDGRRNQRVVDIILSGECAWLFFPPRELSSATAAAPPSVAAAVLPCSRARDYDAPPFTVCNGHRPPPKRPLHSHNRTRCIRALFFPTAPFLLARSAQSGWDTSSSASPCWTP